MLVVATAAPSAALLESKWAGYLDVLMAEQMDNCLAALLEWLMAVTRDKRKVACLAKPMAGSWAELTAY